VRKKSFYKCTVVNTSTPPESSPTTSEATPVTTGPPLMIPHPNTETPLRIPRIPLCRNVHNPQARVAHNYSLVDDLAQSPAAMSVLEVLQTCPTQRKSLLSALGAVDPADTDSSHLISIVENLASPLLSLFKYQLKSGTLQFIDASLMKVHPHASCPNPYGRNLVPPNSYHLPLP
jgi:hypothetical protein